MKLTSIGATAVFALWVVTMGCSDGDTSDREEAREAPGIAADPPDGGPRADRARAGTTLEPKSGSMVHGEAFFVERVEDREDDIAFGVYIEDALPGLHAVHLHEIGDCSADDATSAGGHWNPTGDPHGRWGGEAFHRGDIGNIEVTEAGVGTLEMTTDKWNLGGLVPGQLVVGKAVVVHEGPDDFSTQPDGAAGERIACGVIERTDGPS